MIDTLRKLLLAGLGTLDVTEEKLRAIFDDLVSRGEVTEKEARDLLAGWRQKAGEQKSKIQEQVDEAVRRTLDRMGVARKSDIDALAGRVAALEQFHQPAAAPENQ